MLTWIILSELFEYWLWNSTKMLKKVIIHIFIMFDNCSSMKFLFQLYSFSISISNLLGLWIFLYIIAKNIVCITILYIIRSGNDKYFGIRNKWDMKSVNTKGVSWGWKSWASVCMINYVYGYIYCIYFSLKRNNSIWDKAENLLWVIVWSVAIYVD